MGISVAIVVESLIRKKSWIFWCLSLFEAAKFKANDANLHARLFLLLASIFKWLNFIWDALCSFICCPAPMLPILFSLSKLLLLAISASGLLALFFAFCPVPKLPILFFVSLLLFSLIIILLLLASALRLLTLVF